ncbi:hypothetical protein [Pedobacter frigidisoli]|uniref:hypothetical protein n=1 Tax=Pedobacter frigidisoli TaxID=2530455 RepID=UPI002931CFBF|nr:hypothetical protein [Pedobacter frigidisoli]
MKRTITKAILFFAVILACTSLTSSAQVLPTTTGVSLFCAGSGLTLPPAASNTDWIVRYSATATTTPSTVITLTTGNTIPAGTLQTGYYYLSSKSTTAGSCESEMQEIPVYVLKPLTVDFTSANYCIESPLTQVGTVSSTDPNTTTFAYQWYTVSGSTETAISGATQKDYTPTVAASSVGTTKYLLRAGYLIGTNKYCPETAQHDVVVSAKPTKPTITPGSAIGGATPVTF